jgi:hypothetical protein
VLVKILVLGRDLLHQYPQDQTRLSTLLSASPDIAAIFSVQNVVGNEYVSQLEAGI